MVVENLNSDQAASRDEVDLITVIKGLWSQKLVIIMITVGITLLAAAYAFLSKPIYEAKIGVLPPVLSDISGFNLARGGKSGLKPFTVGEVYGLFVRNLKAEESRREFFEKVYVPSLSQDLLSGSKDNLYRKFSRELRISGDDDILITVQGGDPVQASRWVKQYLEQVTHKSVNDVLQITRSEVEMRGSQIQEQIKTLRIFAKTRREDRLVRLKEALLVADVVGLENPPVISSQITQQLNAFMNGDLMYMRGTQALKAEIETLENRASDEPFIVSLRNLQEQYLLLTSFQVSPESVAVFQQDGAIVVPDAPVKPKKVLILLLGGVLGVFLGVIVALVRLGIKNHSEDKV
ncbi:chain-length determining protein [Microbulbifer agarilyticus]|uniref:Chain-length determining protein n=1 Tax=Microbulbifer agarilyticus TaxID=260552 RepID=A0A1Q2M444_9GAMM|nr:Wzz/FepE/Etk N-terminal domain-containing protein [Microbulbifer agarilyticus]AQQ67503.1 chain-length determining protein [Microbulbifer agarilyticus]